ncbi:MAG: PspC domain-containing protein [Dehalococcoidia bacterium]
MVDERPPDDRRGPAGEGPNAGAAPPGTESKYSDEQLVGPVPPPPAEARAAEAIPSTGEDARGGTTTKPVTPPQSLPPRRLMRSRVHRVIGGVAGGIAERTDTDPGLIRVLFIVLALATAGLALAVYVVLWIVMPLEPPGAAHQGREPAGDGRGAGIVLGLVLVAAGVIWLLEATAAVDLDVTVVLAVSLIAIGGLLVLTLGSVARGGLITLGVVAAIGLVAVSAVDIDVDSGFGDRVERPASAAELESEYSHSFGSMTLDLSRIQFPEGTTRVKAHTAFGSMQVILPASGVAVRIDAETTFGSIDAPEDELSGARSRQVYADPDYDAASVRLDLEVDVSFGSAEVVGR